MMFSVDHPYQSMAEGRAFLEQLPVSAADKERIVRRTAAAFNARLRLEISGRHKLALRTEDDLRLVRRDALPQTSSRTHAD